ncbi:hypothetical protein LA080_011148 [Diaporthe eres]|nr:hypothetical protein LA080_011148 [Diaporthe eres]
MPEPAEYARRLNRKTADYHDGRYSTSGSIRARSDDKTKTIKINSPHSGLVDKVLGRTDPAFWGCLLPQDSNWPRTVLADRHESFPASKSQGYIVGRCFECDLVVDKPYVSNRHCLIYRITRNGQVCVFLRDLSSNGTFVNQSVVGCNKVVELKNGDEITIIDTARFRFYQAKTIYRSFAQQYSLLDTLGKGDIGRVFVCQEKSTGQRFAVKKYTFSPDAKSDQDVKESIAAELNLMGLCHRNITFMKEAFAGDASSSHVTKIAERGDLYDLIVRKSKLSEDETRRIFSQLFDAVKYLVQHERDIVHRDLKPENILILDEELSVVLCSFGLSITITTQNFDTTLCGSPIYVAPEVLAESQHRKYGREVDIWSLGVVLYICLCGFPPFSDDLYSEDFPYSLGQQIKSGKFEYPSPHWDSVGDPALNLIDSMLAVEPQRRFTIEKCLTHPWLTQSAPGQEVLDRPGPVLRRKPTMLRPGQVVPLSAYVASSKELQGSKPRYSPPDPVVTVSEDKGKGKFSSPPVNLSERQKQDRSVNQNLYGEPRYHNPITTEDIQGHLKSISLDKRLSEASSSKATIYMALEAFRKALTAVQFDEVQDIQEAISKTYASRIEELSQLLPKEEEDSKTSSQRLESTAWTPPHSPTPSALKSDVDEGFESEPEATSSARGCTDSVVSLEHDPLAFLVSSAVNKPISPWTTLSTQPPEDLQNDIEFNDRGQESSTWTCTPSTSIIPDEVPLRIDGHPVVLPIEYEYPLTGIFSPTPDPHPFFISPSSQLSGKDIQHVFSTFPTCVGFYLLINGALQVLMPDGFDYEPSMPSFPSEFGGLKVSLIPETVCPTAGEASEPTPTTTATSTRTRFERIFGQSSSPSTVVGSARAIASAGNPSANTAVVSVGCAIRAIVPGSKSKLRFEGKTGVAVTPRDDNSKKYITIPTHLLTDAVLASKTISLDSDAWTKDVKVCIASNSVELGEVTAVFDHDPKSFPIGFSHDISLVDISGIPDTPRTSPYATDLTWLSQQEWMDIKYNSSNLVLLDDRSREAKSIGVVDSRCQMVGQGIFRIQQQSRKRSSFLGSLSSGSSSSRAQDPRDDPSTWTSLVARSILYRVHPEYPARGSQSGVPVCVVSESTDGAAPRSVKVAGFASFVQMVSDVQKYDLEDLKAALDAMSGERVRPNATPALFQLVAREVHVIEAESQGSGEAQKTKSQPRSISLELAFMACQGTSSDRSLGRQPQSQFRVDKPKWSSGTESWFSQEGFTDSHSEHYSLCNSDSS